MEGYDPTDELYCLCIEHDCDETVPVGAHGEVSWSEGRTVYVGRSSYGWASRLKRFAPADAPENCHWHVDYLLDRPTSRLRRIVPLAEPGSRECDLAGWLDDRDGLAILSAGFGASDCEAGCGAHAFITSLSPDNFLCLLRESPFEVPGVIQLDARTCEWEPFRN